MSYNTLASANAYFATRLYTTAWDALSDGDKQKALDWAARIIDRLNFIGEKSAAAAVRFGYNQSYSVYNFVSGDQLAAIEAAGATQAAQFPRGSDTTVPADILTAEAEISYALADGVDPDMEFENLGVISQGYSSVRTTYDRSFVQEHLVAGVPSATAWRYLKPFLRDPSTMRINRV